MTGVERPAKPLPRMVPAELPFWQAAVAGEFRLQRCDECASWRFPPSTICPACLSDSYTWAVASGRGKLWSWIVMRQKYFDSFADDLPYNVALVELDEGPRMMSTIVPYDESRMRCGAPVRVQFQPVNSKVSLPTFALIDSGTAEE